MLIGYSVDTDILLSAKMLNGKGPMFDRIKSAFKTGIMMTSTTIVAVIIALLVTNSDLVKQIMIILLIGLLIELFSGGNVVLIDSSFKIMGLLNSVRKQDRTILPGKQYSFPDKKINPLLDETSIIEQVLKKSDKESIIKAIAIDFSLVVEYAELICRESKVDKNKKISELSQEDFQKIINFIKSLTNITPKGFIYEKSIKPLKDSDEKIIEKYETFCQAIGDSVTEKKYSEEKSLHQNISDKKISRIDNVLNKQEEMIKKILSDYEDNNKKGELIYNEYQDIKLLLDKINNLKKKNLTWNQIKSALENNKLKHVINEKKNEIIIEIEDQPIE
jgi:predicted ribosome quality control (RQC) complex YloA/Tae2 family protein